MALSDTQPLTFEALYTELRRMARRELYKGGQAAHMSPTTLLHEAYLQMSGRPGLQFADRAHFLAYAGRAMRGLAIDHARARGAQKRGGDLDITSLDTFVADNAMAGADAAAEHLEQLAQAMDRRGAIDARLAELVDLKYFVGLTFAEIAALRGGSERTTQRDWEKARALLHGILQA